MASTIMVEITDTRALGLLKELEELHLIRLLEGKLNQRGLPTKLSEKHKGILSREQAASLDEHINQMRNEW